MLSAHLDVSPEEQVSLGLSAEICAGSCVFVCLSYETFSSPCDREDGVGVRSGKQLSDRPHAFASLCSGSVQASCEQGRRERARGEAYLVAGQI